MRADALDRRPFPIGVTGVRIMTGLALASMAALLVMVTWAADEETTGVAPGDVVRVGVLPGQSVGGYLGAARTELAALPVTSGAVELWALVSLTRYLGPDRLTAVLAGAAVAEVYARAPLVGVRTPVVRLAAHRVPDDVVAGMLTTAARRDRERADYHRLGAEQAGSGANETRLRRAYAAAAAIAEAEAAAFRAHCACVFAAVVRAVPAALRDLAGRDDVRAVDPAPEAGVPERAEFRPPLPEQAGDATVLGRDRPVPAATRSAFLPAPAGTSTLAPGSVAPLTSSAGALVTSASSDDPAAGSGPSPAASEERAAVPSAPAANSGRPAASRDAAER